ncbi:penicillin-binding protein 1C [Oxynema sp. CENA135]|uniref:penicillin-binding protein 1C n=1 Tax=Oxynema sp. CENA135 TaxID=984206 RepID=UPI00190D54D7|nr:penicillin-binding protein 1C [Oxynema sp. CENA135]MBK4731783.1 penicillin-binding protein 1C [Oxynema sp. CENA135]
MAKLNALTAFSARKWHQLSVKQQRGVKIALGLLFLAAIVRSLPYLMPIRATDIAQTEQAIVFRDRNGLPLGTLLTRDRDRTAVVGLDRVSPHFIQAILAAEDKRFYRHGALDLQAIARSLLEAVQARQIVSGASTITMQLARMLEPAPRTLPHKLGEIWLSWRLYAGMSRDEILHAYINRLPMGGNLYGVEAAARTYFGVPASDLTIAQASLLAAIPNDPNHLNPNTHWDPLKRRQQYVLDRMVADGYITPQQRDRAYAEQPQRLAGDRGIEAAPHFLFWLANQVPDTVSQVTTTIDRPLQEFAEAQVKQMVRALAPHDVRHAAAIVLDNRTGDVLAYVGSPDYFGDDRLGRNDGVQALRQPGSTLKPFLYQFALEQDIIQPNTILADVPTHYAIPGAKLYSPVDYSEKFLGPARVRLALANSLNVPAVRVLENVGVSAFLDRLHRLGFDHLTQSPEHYGLGLALGSGEVSLWELARAYLTLARRGEAIALNPQIDAPTSHNPRQIGDRSHWGLIIDMLGDRYARARAFGVESVLDLPFPAAVKTGTSSDFRDTWTVGFTRDYTVATWVGNFSGDRMKQVSGVTGAAPLWNRIILHLHENREPAPFPNPPGFVKRPICATTGVKPTPECSAVVLEYFEPQDLANYDRPHPVTLSDDYNEWLARQNTPKAIADPVKIVFPQNDDYFVLTPHEETAKIQLKLAGIPADPVEWRIGDRAGVRKRVTTEGKNSLFYELPTGKWTVEVNSGDRRDLITFEIQATESPNAPRGFSISDRPQSTQND